jgi:hypothetical protein
LGLSVQIRCIKMVNQDVVDVPTHSHPLGCHF